MKTYEELLAERDALACQLSNIQAAVEMLRQSKAGVKRTVAWMTLNGAIKPVSQQYLAEIKAEAGRAGFIEGYEQCHHDIDNDYISRSEPMADEYAAKVRQGGEQ